MKKFVANGGTIFFIDGNVFYTEVKYDENKNRITFIEGHGWQYDGSSAHRGIKERWANETSKWVGRNYLCNSCNIRFGVNPFHCLHSEEQYVTNPNVKIILDYHATVLHPNYPFKPVIATYELDYMKGKVVVPGLYSSYLFTESKFLKLFDSLVSSYLFS